MDKIRKELDEFDTHHLQKLYALLYDRWNWNREVDKELLEITESILTEREGTKMSSDFSDNMKISIHANRLAMTDSSGNTTELLTAEYGAITLSYEFQEAVMAAIVREFQYGCGHNKLILEEIIRNIIANKLGG